MVYIPFPRIDLNNHPALLAWRAKTNKREGDWTELKSYLAEQPRIVSQPLHPIPKCWYTELPQGDDYALDIEHFRPKNEAAPLSEAQIRQLERRMGIVIRQTPDDGEYSWLEFDYRNYRLTSATPNRGGAKHIYFPVVERTSRLSNGSLPWQQIEFPYLLDPADQHDASLLIVLPNGKIEPRGPKVEITDSDLDNLPHSWHNESFNYIRACVTIMLYRLEEKIFEKGRNEVYVRVVELMERLLWCIQDGASTRIIKGFIDDITYMILPSAPFALAARCALEAYVPPNDIAEGLSNQIKQVPHLILNKVAMETRNCAISWNSP